jgi:hypothetical protein
VVREVFVADRLSCGGDRKGAPVEQRRDSSVEGVVEVGPRADYFMFLDGEQLGKVFSQRSGVRPESGEYTRLGRARITVE